MSLPNTSKQWVAAEYPGADFDPFKIFRLEDSIPLKEVSAGQVLVKTTHFSNDPAQRTWVVDWPADRHYIKPVRVGEVMNSMAIGIIISSRHEEFKEGDQIFGAWGWRDFVVLEPSKLEGLQQLHKLPQGVDGSDALALGLVAWTAYVGILNVANIKPTDKTIVISGAAGATGSIAAQIAKNVLGIERVVGIAGSEEKCQLLTSQCGCDIAINYKSPKFEQELKDATPSYIDVYFDNTGGRILDLCLKRMKEYGRVVTCGSIAAYDKDLSKEIAFSAESYFQVIIQKLTIQGFIVTEPRFQDAVGKSMTELPKWVAEGKLKPLKTVWKAPFEQVPAAMTKLLRGENTGKLVTELTG